MICHKRLTVTKIGVIALFLLCHHVCYSCHQVKNNHNYHGKSDHKTMREISTPRNWHLPPRSEIACFTMTTVENRHARGVIRRTFGKILKPMFLMNATADKSAMTFALNEAEVFDDMIIISDSQLVPEIAMSYFLKNFNASKFFLFTRDDVFVNPQNLYNMLNNETFKPDKIKQRKGEFFDVFYVVPGMLHL
jgi:hypothetical protein